MKASTGWFLCHCGSVDTLKMTDLFIFCVHCIKYLQKNKIWKKRRKKKFPNFSLKVFWSALNVNPDFASHNVHCYPSADGDPHFLVELPGRHDALCFNINDKPGTIFNLVRDPQSGLHRHSPGPRPFGETAVNSTGPFSFLFFSGFTVNGLIIGKNSVVPDGPHNALTYFGRLGISHRQRGIRMEVSTQDISILHHGKKTKLLWSNAASVQDNEWVLNLINTSMLTQVSL